MSRVRSPSPAPLNSTTCEVDSAPVWWGDAECYVGLRSNVLPWDGGGAPNTFHRASHCASAGPGRYRVDHFFPRLLRPHFLLARVEPDPWRHPGIHSPRLPL